MDDITEPTPLQAATIGELFEEIAKRNTKGALLIVLRNDGTGTEAGEYWFKGGFYMALGLAHAAANYTARCIANPRICEEHDEENEDGR